MYSFGIEYVFPAELPEPNSNALFEPSSCRIHTLSSLVGTLPLPQLEPTDQSPLVPPFHVSTSFDPIQLPGSKSCVTFLAPAPPPLSLSIFQSF